MDNKKMNWFKYVGYTSLSILALLILLSSSSSATVAEPDPEEWTGSFSGGIDLWYMSAQSYRKAGLNIANDYNNPYLITGIQMTFNLSEAPGYKAKALVQRGDLGEDQDAFVEHQIEGFRYGNEKKQSFLFTEDDYMIVDQNYNIQLRPLRADHLALQHYDDDVDRSRFWDPETGDWDTTGTSPSSPSLDGKEWAMSALVEPVKPLVATQPQTDTFVPPDTVDAYFAELTLGKTYVFFVEHSNSSNFQLYVYSDRDQLGVPGKMTEETLLASTSGSEAEKKVTWTAEYGGRHYVLIKSSIGNGTYEIKYQENLEPIAEAGGDVHANLKLGGSVPVTFENTLSYDPNDDTNNNEKIDLTEDNNLQYYWDFDSEVDADSDGIYTNDKDATGKKLTHTFTKGGKFAVTLTVEDPYGASAADTLDLYLNYIPIVKMDIIVSDDGNAYVEQKLTFNAVGSYDPDDDLNGNGIIDGSEVDRLTYSWDFYDTIDKNMDGNKTNDTDASNKIWEMKYNAAGTYKITLNVWDNLEPPDRAYNHTQIILEVIEEFNIMEYFGVEEHETVEHEEDDNDDVGSRTASGTNTVEYNVSGYGNINLQRIYCEKEGDLLKIGIDTLTKAAMTQPETDEEVNYYLYIVQAPFKEPTITQENFGAIDIDYLYNFSYHYGQLKVMSALDKEDVVFTANYTVNEDGKGFYILIPIRELVAIKGEMDMDQERIDIFAVAEYSFVTTKVGGTQRTFARDAVGEVPSIYPDEWFRKENGNDDDTDDDADDTDDDADDTDDDADDTDDDADDADDDNGNGLPTSNINKDGSKEDRCQLRLLALWHRH